MVNLTGKSPDPAQPGFRADDGSDYVHRQLIGYIGLLLPLLLIVVALWRDGVARWLELDSISAYYYSGAVAAFVGMLVALALFLFAYRGYQNKYAWADRWASNIAGAAALGVAFFPTGAPTGVESLAWWAKWIGVVHYACAVTLFLMFAVFALWLFRLTPDGTAAEGNKRGRNRVYLACGITILGAIAWAGYAGMNDRSIFWPESVALVAFSVSWLVKGYALRSIVDTARTMFRRTTAP